MKRPLNGKLYIVCVIASRRVTFVDDDVERVHLHEEVVLEEDEPYDGEEIDEDDRKDSRQQDRPAVLRYRPDHVQQRLLTVHDVQQLKTQPRHVRHHHWHRTTVSNYTS